MNSTYSDLAVQGFDFRVMMLGRALKMKDPVFILERQLLQLLSGLQRTVLKREVASIPLSLHGKTRPLEDII